jgi:hypothetical protein
MEQLVLLVLKVLRDRREIRDQPALRVPVVLKVVRAFREIRAAQERQVLKALKE